MRNQPTGVTFGAVDSSTLSTVLVPRQAKVFPYSAEPPPAVTVEPTG